MCLDVWKVWGGSREIVVDAAPRSQDLTFGPEELRGCVVVVGQPER